MEPPNNSFFLLPSLVFVYIKMWFNHSFIFIHFRWWISLNQHRLWLFSFKSFNFSWSCFFFRQSDWCWKRVKYICCGQWGWRSFMLETSQVSNLELKHLIVLFTWTIISLKWNWVSFIMWLESVVSKVGIYL